jgi:hypothetical protein
MWLSVAWMLPLEAANPKWYLEMSVMITPVGGLQGRAHTGKGGSRQSIAGRGPAPFILPLSKLLVYKVRQNVYTAHLEFYIWPC